MLPSRVVHNEDAVDWLERSGVLDGCSFVTSLPDLSEISVKSLAEYRAWMVRAASLVLSRTPENGVSIFYQSDIKHEGCWVDKAYLCQSAAERLGSRLLWHKIVCRAPAGTVSLGRPNYSHLICFSRGLKMQNDFATPDVLPEAGASTWTRGMGIKACRVACEFIKAHTTTRTVVDPFCGHGLILAVANELELNGIGIELVARRAQKARTLQSSHLTC